MTAVLSDDAEDLPLLTEVVAPDVLPDAVLETLAAAVLQDETRYQQLFTRLSHHLDSKPLSVVADAPLPLPIAAAPLERGLPDEDYERLVERLEDHLENLLNQKLDAHFARMKQQIVEQVMEELRLTYADRDV